ncbi:UDP-3-O-(3-hydroxymyristoyl)glucosamine N-acyltransferase [Robiginitalea sp. M366]|uniref:UDP-3-O-(3-hydroxymyristoyl)glucosamine N-acyltransferase n=1 Tax=Robiginitalea aestuariiviva TaxID=3036903 RepID=UPI00240E4BDA|nr:UDP-3-O-(3-hydroxymyristoyl)glucosamine N-acyltransferase [Robiginitalea aestuariiviva]MDG1572971.1 UDP-3-O-(3-hydroxymyristoyl)glucosamine N-acyltransferase [Robiginitalea aestuariiviva]
MKFPRTHTLAEVAEIIGSAYEGPADFPVEGMNEIHVVEPGDIVFVDHPKYYDKALQSAATVVLINKKVECPKGKALLISDDPFRDFNTLTRHFRPFRQAASGVHPSARIGKGTALGPNVVIGEGTVIGEDCIIHANAVIGAHCILGNRVVVQSGSVVGSDAFYYKKRPEGFDRLLSGGRAVLEDDVELGALCTIDRGVSGDTRIGRGSKLDNQVHVGHDTVIGQRCLIASQTGIAGCVVMEDEVTLWGQVGVTSAITIGKGAVVLAQTGISKSLKGGQTYFGSPVEEARERLKELAAVRQLPGLIQELKKRT